MQPGRHGLALEPVQSLLYLVWGNGPDHHDDQCSTQDGLSEENVPASCLEHQKRVTKVRVGFLRFISVANMPMSLVCTYLQ